jgi:hypothetical protein
MAEPANPSSGTQRGIKGASKHDADFLKNKIIAHQQLAYDQKDPREEIADMAILLKVFEGGSYEEDIHAFRTKDNHDYQIKPGFVSGPHFDGKEIGSPAHIANVMELMIVAKGSFEKDEGFFNTPYEKELPIAGYIAQAQGFKLKNVPQELIDKIDPAAKAEIDRQLAALPKELQTEKTYKSIVQPITKIPVLSSPTGTLAEEVEFRAHDIHEKYGNDVDLRMHKAHSTFVSGLQDVQKNGNATGLNQLVRDFRKDYGATLLEDKKKEFTTDMDKLESEIKRYAQEQQIAVEKQLGPVLAAAPAAPPPPTAAPVP